MLGKARDRGIAEETVLVVGLGLFGSTVAQSLQSLDVPLIAITDDHNHAVQYADAFTHVIEMNPADPVALEQVGIAQVRKAVVALSRVELSIMTVLALSEAGVEEIWARAVTRAHGSILERIGAHRVIYAEASTGQRVARAISGYMIDYFEFEDGFAMARTIAPAITWDKSLRELLVRTQNMITVIGVKRHNQDFIYAVPETVIHAGDELIVSGQTTHVDAFCKQR